VLAVTLLMAVDGVYMSRSSAAGPEGKKLLDPAAWGSDHVGQPVPMYTEGGECLFCHRHQVGVTWQTNKHNRTIRDAEPTEPAMAALLKDGKTKDFAGEVQLLLGDTRAQRFLKRSEAYGKLDLLTTKAEFGRGTRARLKDVDDPHWDTETFARECAGCHTTAVDPELQAFATPSLDCYACHGDATVDHANDPALMPLAKARKDSPAVVSSICGSCHIRHGKSKATGLPYPTNFVAGDNLFKDFEVDWSVLEATGDKKLNPADAHVLENLRDVVLLGNESLTCLSCHDVHTGSSAKHKELKEVQACWQCHAEATPIKGHTPYEVHSERCRY
jgi:predicted CXXCH cytochrome family protein